MGRGKTYTALVVRLEGKDSPMRMLCQYHWHIPVEVSSHVERGASLV